MSIVVLAFVNRFLILKILVTFFQVVRPNCIVYTFFKQAVSWWYLPMLR